MSLHLDRLKFELKRHGVRSAPQLAAAIGVSQPTLSRLLSAEREVVRIGRGRATVYALERSIRGEGTRWPLYRITEAGNAEEAGVLHALEAGQWWFEQQEPWKSLAQGDFRAGIYPGLPWFLDDMRPQGFLGRNFCRAMAAELDLPPDLSRWTADHVLISLLRFGSDLPGNFVPGDRMLRAALSTDVERPVLPHEDPLQGYLALAAQALSRFVPGSSAGGEQPKFLAALDCGSHLQHVLVKFTGRSDSSEDVRWRDLYRTEHLAGKILSANDIPAVGSRVIDHAGRRFLETVRFDREGRFGRRGVVSLAAHDAAFYGMPFTPWTDAAARMLEDGWIGSRDAELLSIIHHFGTLIGNSDMHYGNVSFFLDREPPLLLTPVYDMLPMAYRPGLQGSIPEYVLAPPIPLPKTIRHWSAAVSMAAAFWEAVSRDQGISPGFREIAGRNCDTVQQLARRFGG